MSVRHMGRAWAGLLLGALLAAGCMDFDGDAYCEKNPQLCTLSVDALSPVAGPAVGGTEVTVSGSAIDPDTVVEVGGVPAPTQVAGATRLTFITPPHPSGRQDVVVRGRYETVTLRQAFHYEPRPEVTSFSPPYASSNGGKPFTVVGTDLGPTPTVSIGGVQVTAGLVLNKEGTRLTGPTPRMPPGIYDVELRNAHGGVTVLPGALRYDVPWVEKRAGLLGGKVRALWVDPADASRVLAAVAGVGLYRSQDGGTTWQHLEGLRGKTVDSLLWNPGSGLLYAATAQHIEMSPDRGDSWSPVARIYQPRSPLVLAPDGALLVLEYSFLMRLSPGARDWTRVSLTEGTASVLAATATDVFLGTSQGVYRLNPGPVPWERVWPEFVVVKSLAPVPERPGSLYVGTSRGFYRWEPGQKPVLLNGETEVLALFPDSTQAGRLHLITRAGLQQSLDSGVTWQPVAGVPPTVAISTVAVSGGRVLVGTEGPGVLVGRAGEALTASNTGMPCADVVSVAVDAARSGHLFAGTPGGLFQSVDDGDSWTMVPWAQVPPPVGGVRVAGADARFVFATSVAGLRRSRDGGASWEVAGPQGRIQDLVVLPTVPPTVYAATDVDVQVSRDGGDTWAAANAGLMTGVETRLAAAGPGPSFTLYAAQRGYLHALTPDSTQWVRAGAFARGFSADIESLAAASSGAVLAAGPSVDFGGGGGQLHEFGDLGRTVALLDADQENAFVGGPASLVRATASATAFSGWTDITAGMTGTSVRSITAHPSDSTRLYVGTEGFGVQVSTVRGY
ncbi:IPT/TIG domain-containing protein [Pyxidicoccus sp. 3LFB2]